MTDVVVVDGARTAHGSLLGALSERTATELGQAVIEGLLDRTGVDHDRGVVGMSAGGGGALALSLVR
jgi:acetyl-CoA acetyltransferase